MSGPLLLCPSCAAVLEVPAPSDTEARCARDHSVPALGGIIDCRSALVGFDIDADRTRAVDLVGMAGASFEDLLRHYWASLPEVAPHLAERFTRGDLIGMARAEEVATQIEVEAGGQVGDGSVVLEVGCGSAALGAALARRATWVVASDISLAWLVMAQRRLEGLGLTNVTLVAATVDRMPVAADTFGLVVAADVVEHVPDVAAMVTSCRRVLRPGGTLWVSTPNRYSLTPEPHVRLWGVGFLPRPVALRYVARFRGVDYADVRTLSAWRLRRILRSPVDVASVEVPPIAAAVRATYGPLGRRAIDAYHRARRLPGVRQLLLLVAPLFHGTLRKGGDGS